MGKAMTFEIHRSLAAGIRRELDDQVYRLSLDAPVELKTCQWEEERLPSEGKKRETGVGKDLFRFFAVAKDKEKYVGYSNGWESSPGVYFMNMSAVIPAYQNLGIYTKLLHLVIQHVKKQGYFHKIFSLHHASNIPILLAKIKRGFYITGYETHWQTGQLVELSYFLDKDREDKFKERHS